MGAVLGAKGPGLGAMDAVEDAGLAANSTVALTMILGCVWGRGAGEGEGGRGAGGKGTSW